MAKITLPTMKGFLRKSLSSFNSNKLNGLLAELDFRNHLGSLGFGERVSPGGWIFRRTRENFGQRTVVVFPEVIVADKDYPVGAVIPDPPHRLHTACATFHQSGIHAFYCYPSITKRNQCELVRWDAVRMGVPMEKQPRDFLDAFADIFVTRNRKYNPLRYNSKVRSIPNDCVPEEFSKEHIRVSFASRFYAETSDVDGIFWGEQHTYPIEIKEKTAAKSDDLGEWFGLDVGPFVKLAYYASKRGNLHSLFVVREIDHEETRRLVAWRFITFDQLAQYASWVFRGGGQGMGGARSAVVRVPKSEFKEVTAEELERL